MVIGFFVGFAMAATVVTYIPTMLGEALAR
jgi:hypothetical protein